MFVEDSTNPAQTVRLECQFPDAHIVGCIGCTGLVATIFFILALPSAHSDIWDRMATTFLVLGIWATVAIIGRTYIAPSYRIEVDIESKAMSVRCWMVKRSCWRLYDVNALYVRKYGPLKALELDILLRGGQSIRLSGEYLGDLERFADALSSYLDVPLFWDTRHQVSSNKNRAVANSNVDHKASNTNLKKRRQYVMRGDFPTTLESHKRDAES